MPAILFASAYQRPARGINALVRRPHFLLLSSADYARMNARESTCLLENGYLT